MHRTRLRSTRTPRRPRLRTTVALFTGLLLAVGTPATVAGAHPGHPEHDEPAAAEGQFQQVPLAKGEPEMGEPMSLAVLPDRSVLHTSRDGTLRLTDQGGVTKVAGKISVYSHDEEGLQGVGIDPDFTNNRAIYLYYAPPLDTPAGDAPETGTAEDFKKFDGVNRLSRFVLNAQRHAEHVQREEGHRRRGLPRHLLPRRRRHRLRRGRQPLPVDRRRHQPLRLRRLHPDRRPRGPQPGLRRPPQRRQHQRPARQDPADQGRRGRLVHRPARATSSPRAPRRPAPRSTRWASATRSG